MTLHGQGLKFADQARFIVTQIGDNTQSGDWTQTVYPGSDDLVEVSTGGFYPQGNPPFAGVWFVHNPAGWCPGARYEILPGRMPAQPPPSPPKVSVPDVAWKALSIARQKLASAGLKSKLIYGPDAPAALVNSVAPGFGAQVNPGSEVDLTTQANVLVGISKLVVSNGIQSQHSLHIWSFDNSTNVWNEENGGKALEYQDSVTIDLGSGHTFQFFAVDPSAPPCGGQNNPHDANCVPENTPPVTGNSGGGTGTWLISAP